LNRSLSYIEDDIYLDQFKFEKEGLDAAEEDENPFNMDIEYYGIYFSLKEIKTSTFKLMSH